MLIVTGANGKLGRLVVEALLNRVPADRLGVSVRDPEKAADLAARGVRVRRGAFEDVASLSSALEGAARVLIVSSNSAGDEAVRQHRTAIDAAKAAGARRILYTSHVGASATSPFAPMRDHFATETALRDSGVAFTSLRNGFYAASVPMMLGAALTTGELRTPEDGPVSWTSHADLAEAAAMILGEEEPFESSTFNLTGAEAIDMNGIATIVSELAGRPIRRVVEPAAEFRAGLVARGLPEARAELFLGLFEASRQGQFARVDPALRRLIGREPRSLRDELAAALSGVLVSGDADLSRQLRRA
jgi:NAD(P)H dehydrogenase (quinone)